MPTGTISDWFYIGKFDDFERTPGDTSVDPDRPPYTRTPVPNSEVVLGNYTNLELVHLTAFHTADDNLVANDDYDAGGPFGFSYNEGFTYDLGDGLVTTRPDSDVYATADVTYRDADGNIQVETINVNVAQMDNGDVFVTDQVGYNGFDNKEIISFEITAITDAAGGSDGITWDNSTFENSTVGAPPCFVTDTRIMTAKGAKKVDKLKKGDLVLTADRGHQPIKMVISREIDKNFLKSHPHLRPIKIKKGALGENLPLRDLYVSPHHRMLVANRLIAKLCETEQALVEAKDLLRLDGVSVDAQTTNFAYFHIIFENHEIIYAEGAPTESFHKGEQSLASISDEARNELETIFPLLKDDITIYAKDFVRPVVEGQSAKNLTQRMARNRRDILEPKRLNSHKKNKISETMAIVTATRDRALWKNTQKMN